MSRHLASFAALVLAWPALGLADPAATPVVVNSCALTYDSSNIASQITGLQVQFTNNGPKTAHIVNIKADFSGNSQIIRDVGTFSAGAPINHKFKTQTGEFALPAVLGTAISGRPNVVCTIDSVVYDDGTTWIAPAVAFAPPGHAEGLTVVPNTSVAFSAMPSTLFLYGAGPANARIVLASGGGPLSLKTDCDQYANVKIVATTAHDVAISVTPKAEGKCALTIRDSNGNSSQIPVYISGS